MYLKASYTVEGAGVISICMIIIGMCIMLAFSLYHESVDYLESVTVENLKSVDTFLNIQTGKELAEKILD